MSILIFFQWLFLLPLLHAQYTKHVQLSGVYHVIMYGQSLMLGTASVPVLTTKQKYNTLMFSGGVRSGYDASSQHYYDSLVPLVEKQVTSNQTGAKLGETPASGFSEMMMSLLKHENGLRYNPETKNFKGENFALLISSPAQGSMSVKALSSGIYWQRFQRDVREGYKLARASGKAYNVPFVLWNQGERDIDLNTPPELYKAALSAFQKKADHFVKSVTHQHNTVWLVLYQTSSHNVRKAIHYPVIANAQYELAKNAPYITMSNATYQLPYSREKVHFTNIGSKWNGADHAVACKRIWIDHMDWRSIYVTQAQFSGDTIRMSFHVPVPPLVLDTEFVSNPGSFGFNLFNEAGNEIPIDEVSLTGDTTIQIIAVDRIVHGDVVWYGNNGIGTGPVNGARGNLRDSQGDHIRMTIENKKIRIDNWTPILKADL